MKPFKFLSNPFIDYQHDMVIYEEGWVVGNADYVLGMAIRWWDLCPYQHETREYYLWGEGYLDRYALSDRRRTNTRLQ